MRRDEQTGCRRPTRDGGTSLIEQLIAISVIAAVLLGLLAALGATATSVSAGRQRTIAVSLAKQAIENLQGAAYTDVATNLVKDELSSHPLVSGTVPNLLFDGEPLVAGSSTSYLTKVDEAGTTFWLRTFVTAVTPVLPATGDPYRRITVIVDWNTTGTVSTSAQRTMRFSSLVFPLDYTSYPASSGSAEAIGGSLMLTGTLDGETFDELHLALPGTHATTDSSTLRTSIATAASSTSTVALQIGAVTSATCPVYGDGTDRECPRASAASVADNDTGTNTGVSAVAVAQPFSAAEISTPAGTTVLTPAGIMTSRATVATCAGCGFGDADGLPWSEASLDTTSASSAAFQVDAGLGGTLVGLADHWSPSVTVDHDAAGGGLVLASATLTAPEAHVFDLAAGAPAGFDGAVRVSGFTATASVTGGHTTVAPTTTATTATVEIWDDSLPGYRIVTFTPGDIAGTDITATASFVVGDHTVALTSRVQSQPATVSTTGDSPRSHGAAQHPSLLLVTVVVTVTTGGSSETFTIVLDYGRVSAAATWLVEPT